MGIKNGELNEINGRHMPAHRVIRVMLAAHKQGADYLALYTAFGIKHFLAGEEYGDELIAKVLSDHKLDPSLIKTADDASLDKELEESIKEATDIVGQDIGVPTIVFLDEEGKPKTGYFGPVLQTLPDQEEAAKLWDSLAALASDSNFYELKRGRPSGGPDVYSTAKC